MLKYYKMGHIMMTIRLLWLADKEERDEGV